MRKMKLRISITAMSVIAIQLLVCIMRLNSVDEIRNEALARATSLIVVVVPVIYGVSGFLIFRRFAVTLAVDCAAIMAVGLALAAFKPEPILSEIIWIIFQAPMITLSYFQTRLIHSEKRKAIQAAYIIVFLLIHVAFAYLVMIGLAIVPSNGPVPTSTMV